MRRQTIQKVLFTVILTFVILSQTKLTVLANELFVRISDNQTLHLIVEPGDSIDHVKDHIRSNTGFAAEIQRLYFNGRELENGHTLADYSVQDRDTIDLRLETITCTVTFQVKNGSWNEGGSADKKVRFTRYANEDRAFRLTAAQIPAVGNKPDNGYKKGGKWTPSTPDTERVINRDITFIYTYPDDDDDDPASGEEDAESDEDKPAPAPKPVNPNAISVLTYTGIPTGVKVGPQEQGPSAQLAFRLNTPAGWKEAFTFNMTQKDNADYTLKKGTLSFRIPSQYLKDGRKFAILGIDQNGNVKTFPDTDTEADTITVSLYVEGYAFDLIYFD